jgi:hypothetical protein
MARTDKRESLDHRVREVARLLREHRALVDPDPSFVRRVVSRLPRREVWMLAWAARRVVPVAMAVAAVLAIAVFVTGGSRSKGVAAASIASSQNGSDPLDWLLEDRRESR